MKDKIFCWLLSFQNIVDTCRVMNAFDSFLLMNFRQFFSLTTFHFRRTQLTEIILQTACAASNSFPYMIFFGAEKF